MNPPSSPAPAPAWKVDAALILDAAFASDGRLSAWARLPDATWRALAPVLAGRYDRIGFGFGFGIRVGAGSEDFLRSGIARALELEAAEAMPGHAIDGQRYDLQVCEFNAYTAYLLGRTVFNHWNCNDAELCADDICFFRDGRVELLAQPWNSMLHFFAVEHRFLQDVEAAHPRFAGAVYVRENGGLRGV
ncbi:hypothetical protein J5226_20615 [Lysobacter sp. K5869]|uniref:hypothetical protein n=1 Tax=Lysobacter sp. K5869 TaxID=2820808 RepID=UPI001C061176|nr:hypothetical protein [Lysobacter sp. K5869]QWP75980.1 hypothetical protein J5226_20615 [Lysobacter sp. K5869]